MIPETEVALAAQGITATRDALMSPGQVAEAFDRLRPGCACCSPATSPSPHRATA